MLPCQPVQNPAIPPRLYILDAATARALVGSPLRGACASWPLAALVTAGPFAARWSPSWLHLLFGLRFRRVFLLPVLSPALIRASSVAGAFSRALPAVAGASPLSAAITCNSVRTTMYGYAIVPANSLAMKPSTIGHHQGPAVAAIHTDIRVSSCSMLPFHRPRFLNTGEPSTSASIYRTVLHCIAPSMHPTMLMPTPA